MLSKFWLLWSLFSDTGPGAIDTGPQFMLDTLLCRGERERDGEGAVTWLPDISDSMYTRNISIVRIYVEYLQH